MSRIIQRLRSLLIDFSCSGMNWSTNKWFFDPSAPLEAEPTWRNRLGWWIEGQFTRVFNVAYPGSDNEADDAWETPLPYLSPRQVELIWPAFDEMEAYCNECFWAGSAYDLQFSEGYHFCCPECHETSTRLDTHGNMAPWCSKVRASRAAKGGA